MAGIGLIALLDDIATVLDDVSLMTKLAAKKTAGVLGDDLALNAEQVSGVRADRELPVVWAVAKGSARNKLILVPIALTCSALMPWLISPLLMLGGAYLCFEGFEKIYHKLRHPEEDEQERQQLTMALHNPRFDLLQFEKKKIRGAIRTDFVLSAEIIVIALGTVKHAELLQQILVVSGIAAIMTAGVYALVAAIVKLDDLGLFLQRCNKDKLGRALAMPLGAAILWSCPYLMKTLAIAGTAAMFLVGGGILVHGIPAAHSIYDAGLALLPASLPGWFGKSLLPLLFNALAGILAGALLVMVLQLKQLLKPLRKTS